MALALHVWRGEVLAALARVLDYAPNPDGGFPPPVPHHARVAALAARVASHLRVDRLGAFYAGLVHDIGLLGVRDPDLWRNLQEQANRPLVRAHPIIGAEMVAETPELFHLAPMILDHHECINGHGYPRGKSGAEIDTAAQILRFADTCDALLREQAHRRSSRSCTRRAAGPPRRYRPSWPTPAWRCWANRASTPNC